MRLLPLVFALVAAPAAAQGPEPVAGFVVDIRGATSGLPKQTGFFPNIPADSVVPARGFGFDAGAHVYLFRLGPSRVGIGANYMRARGTAPGVATNVSLMFPQISFNFGSREGWSYLSGGVGRARVETTVDAETGSPTSEADGLTAVNYGGGARWFLRRHIGVGFDARFHRISGPPKTSFFSASVGFSVR